MASDEIEAARSAVISAMERSAAEYGLPRSCGRVYGVLYFADDPLSMDELTDRSGYAKSTVSDAARTLENLYLIRPVSPPEGGRRSYFEPERDLWYAFRRVAEESGRREIEIMRRALEEAEATLTDVDGGEMERQRIRTLRESYEYAEEALELLEKLPPETLIEVLSRAAAEVEGGRASGRGSRRGNPDRRSPD